MSEESWVQEEISKQAHRMIRHGYGDLTAPLLPGEYRSARLECPHAGCDWTLDTEWRRGADISRVRGAVEIDRMCQAHLETHLHCPLDYPVT